MNLELELEPLFGIGRVTAQGIHFQDRNYSCLRAISDRWFEFASEIGPWPVVVLYEPESIESIIIVCHGENILLYCDLIKNDQPSKIHNYIQSIQFLKDHRKTSSRSKRTKYLRKTPELKRFEEQA